MKGSDEAEGLKMIASITLSCCKQIFLAGVFIYILQFEYGVCKQQLYIKILHILTMGIFNLARITYTYVHE